MALVQIDEDELALLRERAEDCADLNRQLGELNRHMSKNPIPYSYLVGAYEFYRDKCSGMTDCCEPRLVGVKWGDSHITEDMWAVTFRYNTHNSHAVVGVTADGRFKIYAD